MTITKNPSSLLLLKQERDETLKSFIKRYHEEFMEVRAFTHSLALKRLKNGLKMDREWFVVHKRKITMYEQV